MISQEQVIHLVKRKGKLKAQRGTWESHWQDLTNFVLPNDSDFNLKRSKGDKRTTLVYDSTAIHANEMLAAGLHGMLTNPASNWFSLRIKDNNDFSDNAEAKQWLEETTNVILSELSAPAVAFPSHIHEYYLSLCSIGTACMFIGEPTRREGISFRAIHIDEIFIAENADGIIDTVFRCFKMSCCIAFTRVTILIRAKRQQPCCRSRRSTSMRKKSTFWLKAVLMKCLLWSAVGQRLLVKCLAGRLP
jgi:hypothetical protein